MAGIRRKGEVQSLVKKMSKAGATTKQIQAELKNQFGKAYRKQEIQEDMRNYTKKVKKDSIKKPLEKRVKEYKKEKKTSDTPLPKKQSKYTPKKYRTPEITGYRRGRDNQWQKKKYSVVIGYRYIPYGGRTKEETFRTLSYNELPPNEAIILRDAMEVWINEATDERILLPSSSDQVTGRVTQKNDIWIESITEFIP